MHMLLRALWIALFGVVLFIASLPGSYLQLAVAVALVAMWLAPPEMSVSHFRSVGELAVWALCVFALAAPLASVGHYLHQQQSSQRWAAAALAVAGMGCAAALSWARRRQLRHPVAPTNR